MDHQGYSQQDQKEKKVMDKTTGLVHQKPLAESGKSYEDPSKSRNKIWV